mmetsp:Transcript_19540/g.53509  ORF Transcript_19540/g.53509 Transcript_19540/m.53509 type:complete len:603 (-) Transcript_19540:11-1819(-)
MRVVRQQQGIRFAPSGLWRYHVVASTPLHFGSRGGRTKRRFLHGYQAVVRCCSWVCAPAAFALTAAARRSSRQRKICSATRCAADASQDVAAPAIHAGFLSFPASFHWGVATSAYQIEGAAATGGRKPSIWDDFSHMPNKTHQGATGDVACEHYHRYRDDVAIMASLGIRDYRFSISWSRLIPDGVGDVNEEGAAFYSDLIDSLLEHGITPWVTLYHWDLPSALEADFGGWLGPKERITGAFGDYARTCFARFGDRVRHWITLNEPWCSAMLGYNTGQFAPGRTCAKDTEPYVAAHNMLLAHAEAVRIYRAEFVERQRGRIGITLNADWRQPWNPSNPADVIAAERAMDFSLGWFAHPVYFGHYPHWMRSNCGDRLPEFTPEESALLRGSSDFFGLNSYSSNFVCPPSKPLKGGGYWEDIDSECWHRDKEWETTDMDWPIVPWGLRELLLHVQRTYAPPGGIIITENGCAHEPAESDAGTVQPKSCVRVDPATREIHFESPCEDLEGETFDDPERVRFFRAHLSAVHAAHAGGADVRGYFAWSLLDNFEWGEGYSKRFGIVRVDYETQKRTIKASGRFFASAIREGGFNAPPAQEQYPGTTF